jgi:hypothetical protein
MDEGFIQKAKIPGYFLSAIAGVSIKPTAQAPEVTCQIKLEPGPWATDLKFYAVARFHGLRLAFAI